MDLSASASPSLQQRHGLSRRTVLRTAAVTGAAAVLGQVGGVQSPAAAAGARPMGLADRHKRPRDAYRAGVPTWVVSVAWRDLQASAGAPLDFDAPTITGAGRTGASLREAIKEASRAGAVIRLRPLAGAFAPRWAKALTGKPLHWNGPATDTAYGLRFTVPRWWEPEYLAAYHGWMRRLAARYDDNPAVGDVTVSATMTVFPEPFIRQISDEENRVRLLRAGYTPDLDVAALKESIRTHEAVWLRTSSSLALNPYESVRPDGGGSFNDVTTPIRVATFARRRLGTRAVLGNNSIRDPESGGGHLANYKKLLVGELYPAMQALGCPLYFQTDIPARIGSLQNTVAYAISLGAETVELPWTYASGRAAGSGRVSTSEAEGFTSALMTSVAARGR